MDRNLICSFCISALMVLISSNFAVAGERQLRMELGAGVSVAPSYEGADDRIISLIPIISFVSFKSDEINIGGKKDLGWRFGPSFRILGDRNQSDGPELLGIPDVDHSIEAGVHLGYEWQNARVFAKARYGFTGHDGFVGELGADVIYRPTDQLDIYVGPRLSFADNTYMDAYFSVPDTARNLPAYEASSGIKSAGIGGSIRYDFSDRWAVVANAQWDRLVGDAADSPIVKAGSKDQISGRFGLVYKFDFDF